MNLRAIQGHRPQLQHAHLARQKQNLHEQRADLLQKALAEGSNRIVIGMLVGGYEPEGHGVIGGPLQLAAGEHARGIAVDKNGKQHRRMIAGRTRAAIDLAHRGQVQPLHDLHHEAGQMPLRQPVLDGRRQQIGRLPVDGAEITHGLSSKAGRINRPTLHPMPRAKLSPTGC